MPLVKAICTNCNAPLTVDNEKDAAICPYCGTPYVVDKAITTYNNTYNITTPQLNISMPIETENAKARKILDKAATYSEYGDFGKAQTLLCQASEKFPEECSVWVALLQSQIEYMKREKSLYWQNIGYDHEAVVNSYPDLIKMIKVTSKTPDIAAPLERQWENLIDSIYTSIKNGCTDYFLTEDSRLCTSNGIQYYEYAELPFRYEHIRKMHSGFEDLYAESQANSQKLADAGLYFGPLRDRILCGPIGWWSVSADKFFPRCIVLGRCIFFEKIMDLEGWRVWCMCIFDENVCLDNEHIAQYLEISKKNLSKLDQCPFCGSHKFTNPIFGGQRRCKGCKRSI